jgi:hypothetical protein
MLYIERVRSKGSQRGHASYSGDTFHFRCIVSLCMEKGGSYVPTERSLSVVW